MWHLWKAGYYYFYFSSGFYQITWGLEVYILKLASSTLTHRKLWVFFPPSYIYRKSVIRIINCISLMATYLPVVFISTFPTKPAASNPKHIFSEIVSFINTVKYSNLKIISKELKNIVANILLLFHPNFDNFSWIYIYIFASIK